MPAGSLVFQMASHRPKVLKQTERPLSSLSKGLTKKEQSDLLQRLPTGAAEIEKIGFDEYRYKRKVCQLTLASGLLKKLVCASTVSA